MASEYYKWLARNEKPREKRELTPREKWNNWWDYHSWHVVGGIAAALFVGYLLFNYVTNQTLAPDYGIAYVGSEALSEETVQAVQTRFGELGEDLNGDGEVVVQVNQYLIYTETSGDEEGLYANYAGVVQMMADFESKTSFYFLMDTPVEFQTDYEALAYPDGTVPQAGTVEDRLWIPCGDCPGLADLKLEGLYLGRRIFLEDVEYLSGWESLWYKIIG